MSFNYTICITVCGKERKKETNKQTKTETKKENSGTQSCECSIVTRVPFTQGLKDRIPGHLFGFTRLAEAQPPSVTRDRGKQLFHTEAPGRCERGAALFKTQIIRVIWEPAMS